MRAPWAQLIATVLTVAAIMAISQPLVPLYRIQPAAPRTIETSPRGFLTFLVPAHPPSAVRSPMRTAGRSLNTTQRSRPDPAGPLSISLTPLFPSSRLSEPAVPQPQAMVTLPATTVLPVTASATPSPDVASPTRRAVGPRLVPSGISIARPLTTAARDSVLAHLSSDVPMLAKTWRPTPAETDSSLREQSMIERAARELNLHVAPPTIGAAVSVSLGLLSPVPSRKQQVRDSIVNADIRRHIARIVERARAKRDSIRRVDSLAVAERAATDSAVRPGMP